MLNLDDKIVELRASGLSCVAVSEQLGVSQHTVWACMRRRGLQGKYRGNRRDDEYVAKRPKKHKLRASPFSILVQGNFDFINVRLLPTSKKQAKGLLELLQKQGGEVVFENGAGLEK